MKERNFNIITFVVAVIIVISLFWLFISTSMSVHENPPFTINKNIDTGKAFIENDVHLIQGGDIIFSYTFHPFPCPHCGKQINIETDFPKED